MDCDRMLDFLGRQLHNFDDSQMARHYLLLGPSDEQSLLLLKYLVQFVENSPGLRARYLPIRYPKQFTTPKTLDAFWHHILSAMTDLRLQEGAGLGESTKLFKHMLDTEKRTSLPIDEQDGFSAWRAIAEHCQKQRRRPLLLVEDLPQLLEGLTPIHQWGLRRVLQLSTGPIMFARGQKYPTSVCGYSDAFFDFFRVIAEEAGS